MPSATVHNGVEWAASRSGRYQIALRCDGTRWRVWTLRTGTHDMGPHTRRFATEAPARAYANKLYREI